ncbi:uncharacterized protein H6S33_006604 [Morchella sextelata]|uniref:uncharacterized protein n=1 Tax=Morchella sextelata TaxID=1174677 RepID=UPI001D047FD3|nr:uncharacterized protein H6S33_006604 [Morchella sextelata]KAH0604227.1 hypothetical protein H6S33_006604 [Morchella sextelata]
MADALESAVKSLENIAALVTGAQVSKPLTSSDLLRPLTGPGRIVTNLSPRPPNSPNGTKTASTTAVNKLQSQNASLISTNNQLKNETAKIKNGLLEAYKSLTEAKKGLVILTRDLSNTKKELLKAKEANDELADALESRPTSSRPRSTKNPVISSFNTKNVRPDTVPVEKTSKHVTFAKPYKAPPSMAIGLYALDVASGDTMRISTFISNLENNRFEVNIDGNPVNSGGCIWLEIEPDHQDFQCGRYSTLEDHPWSTSQATHERRISFARPYDEPPEVVVWLSAFNMHSEKDWRVKSFASDITATGFTVHIETWGDSQLCAAAASWIAYPREKADVCSGSFSTTDVRPRDNPRPNTSGPVEFAEDMFSTTPRVVLGINSLDAGCEGGLRLELMGTDVSSKGMTWNLNSWKDTTMYSAGGTYIALT